jgi:hypothetical protein
MSPGKRAAIHGAVSAIVLSFPAAAFMALCYRFPAPFAGKQYGGPDAVADTPFTVIAYGVFLLGFLPLGAMGAACGIAVARFSSGLTVRGMLPRIYATTFLLDLVVALLMAFIPF